MFVFLFKQKTAYEMRISYWSSDVCSSDLAIVVPVRVIAGRGLRGQLVREKVIEAGFERMDVDIVELATPVGLDAEVPGQPGRLSGIIPIDCNADLRGVAVENLHDFHRL